MTVALPPENLARPRAWLRVVFCLYCAALVTTMSGMEIFSSLLSLGVLVWYLVVRPGKLAPLPFGKPLLAFALVVVAGVILGPAPFAEKLRDIGRMRFFLLYAGTFYYLFYFGSDSATVDDPGRLPWMRTLILVTTLVGIYGFIQHFVAIDIFRPEGKKVLMYAIEDQKIGPLVVGTFNHHLTFSNIYLFYVALFLSLGAFYFPKKPQWLALGLFLALLCVWSQSRAAWGALPFVMVFVALGRGWKPAALAVALCLVAAGAFYATDAGFRTRVERTVFQNDDLYNLGPRMRLWNAQIVIFRERPILGIGYNNNERFAKDYVDRLYPEIKDNFYGHAHSAPLQILATTGIVGLFCYVWLWWTIFVQGWRAMKTYSQNQWQSWMIRGLLAGLLGFQIQGLTQWNFGDAEVLHTLMFVWALLAFFVARRVTVTQRATASVPVV